MKIKEFNYTKGVLALILISAIIRIALAFILDLRDYEAYFRTFVLFPELSNFDKPPMIGWLIQLFTNNLFFNSEFAIRLSSLVCGSISMWLIYVIARRLSRDAAGFYSVLLFATSFYFSLYSSLFALPDSPQVLFYLLSLYFIIEALLPSRDNCKESATICNMAYILAGLFIGLSILSEFSSAIIWPAIFIYLSIYNRSQFKKVALYLSFATSLLFITPLYIWYFGFSLPDTQSLTLIFNYDTTFSTVRLLKGLLVVIVLNNPVNVLLIFYSLFKYKKEQANSRYNLLITISFITALAFLLLSVFFKTSAHSISHTFIPLLLIAGDYISREIENRKKRVLSPSLHKSIYLYLALLSIIILNNYTGIINNNVFVSKNSLSRSNSYFTKSNDYTSNDYTSNGYPSDDYTSNDYTSNDYTSNDYTSNGYTSNGYPSKSNIYLSKLNSYLLSQFGWSDLTPKFNTFLEKEKTLGYLPNSFCIIENNYKKAAIIDYYIASPNHMNIKAIGAISEIRKYAWITQKLKFFTKGENAYYIDDSSSPDNAFKFGQNYFERVEKASNIYIMRLGRPVKRYTIYRFLHLKTIPPQ